MFRSVLARLLLLFLSLWCAPTPLAAQSNPSVSISVLVQTFGQPHAQIPVTLQIQSSALDSEISAPADLPTNMTFSSLRPGSYHIVASNPDRAPVQLDLTLSAGESVQLTLIVDRVFPLTLQPPAARPSPTATPTPAPTSTPAPTHTVEISPESSAPAPDSSFELSAAKSSHPSDFVTACSLNNVLPHVSANIEQFVDNVNRITATELVDLERRRHDGKVEDRAHSTVNYLADIQLRPAGYMSVDEYRNGRPGMTAFEGYLSVSGSTALVLIFHPVHLSEFAISCRGLLEWQGSPAYLLGFQQRIDRPNTMSEFRSNNNIYPIHLKGLAWVDSKTFQVVHLETDLLLPIPQVALYRAHQSVDYGPIPFTARKLSLWLPLQSDISIHRHGKQFNERHSYRDYQLFAVDTDQKIANPKQAPTQAPAEPAAESPKESREETHQVPQQTPSQIPD